MLLKPNLTFEAQGVIKGAKIDLTVETLGGL